MTPNEMLQTADLLLSAPPDSMADCWQRASAALTRSALEKQMAAYWEAAEPSLAHASKTHQLLALPYYVDREVAQTTQATWHGLSRAVHHHTYELSPTLPELRSWHAEVVRAMAVLTSTTA